MDATWIDSRRIARRGSAGDRALTRPGMRFVSLPSGTLRVRTGGSGGPAVVSIPDPPNVIEHHDRQFELLEAWARPVLAELPGAGFSVPTRDCGFTIDEAVTALAELLEELDQGPYVLAFACASAYIALRLAARRPELVSALALVQAPAWSQEVAWTQRMDTGGVMRTPVAGQLAVLAAKRPLARHWYGVALPRDASEDTRREFLEPSMEALRGGGQYSLASMFQGILRDDGRFDPVEQPTLALWGGADRTHGRSDGGSIDEHAPGARVVEFPEAGHFPDLEQPERFAELLRDHLRSSL